LKTSLQTSPNANILFPAPSCNVSEIVKWTEKDSDSAPSNPTHFRGRRIVPADQHLVRSPFLNFVDGDGMVFHQAERHSSDAMFPMRVGIDKKSIFERRRHRRLAEFADARGMWHQRPLRGLCHDSTDALPICVLCEESAFSAFCFYLPTLMKQSVFRKYATQVPFDF